MRKAGRLGPQPKKVIVIVGKDDPPTRPHRSNHGLDDF
jgi:hypothetical protein